jgi:sec-independent protein translocase protein TatA
VIGLDNPIHLLFLIVVLLLVFGAKRLPEIGHSLGSGMRGFKDALSGAQPASATSLTASTPEVALGAGVEPESPQA